MLRCAQSLSIVSDIERLDDVFPLLHFIHILVVALESFHPSISPPLALFPLFSFLWVELEIVRGTSTFIGISNNYVYVSFIKQVNKIDCIALILIWIGRRRSMLIWCLLFSDQYYFTTVVSLLGCVIFEVCVHIPIYIIWLSTITGKIKE